MKMALDCAAVFLHDFVTYATRKYTYSEDQQLVSCPYVRGGSIMVHSTVTKNGWNIMHASNTSLFLSTDF